MTSPSFSWPPAPAQLALSDGEVHVFGAALARPPGDVARLASLLSDEERDRAGRYRGPAVRDQFIVARGLLRTILGRYLALEPWRIAFCHGPQGKPLLAGPGSLHFNVSHSQGMALYALTRLAEVGVDVERVRPMTDELDLAQRFFCAAEAAALAALDAGPRRQTFFRIWTCKEAYLKANGTGLAHGLERVEILADLGVPPRIVRIDGQEALAARWSLEGLAPAPEYVGALALPRVGYRLCCWTWDR